jgi:PhnB protein
LAVPIGGDTLLADPEEAAMADVNPIPADYPRVMPYLSVDDADAAIAFYRTVFDATERVRMDAPGGKIGHAELQIGDSVVMLADTMPEAGNTSPKDIGGTPVGMMVYVEDVDATHRIALENGASELRKPEDQFYGDRAAQFEDPFGHRWFIASHIEDVPPEEMGKRAAAAMGG